MSVAEPGLILVIDSEANPNTDAVAILEGAGYSAHTAARPGLIQAMIQDTPPHCIIVPFELKGASPGMTLAEELKNDTIYGHLPMLMTLSREALPLVDWGRLKVDEFLLAPYAPEELLARVQICLARAQRDRSALSFAILRRKSVSTKAPSWRLCRAFRTARSTNPPRIFTTT